MIAVTKDEARELIEKPDTAQLHIGAGTAQALIELQHAAINAKTAHMDYRDAVDRMEGLEQKAAEADELVMRAQVKLRSALELE